MAKQILMDSGFDPEADAVRYILTIVEQLDRAARELATDHPINNRLALILVDNATELMLHRQCTDRLDRDSTALRLWNAYQALADHTSPEDQPSFSEHLTRDLMTPTQRSMGKGNHLSGKLKLLEPLRRPHTD